MVGSTSNTCIRNQEFESMHIKGKLIAPIGILIVIMGAITAISGFSELSEIDPEQKKENFWENV